MSLINRALILGVLTLLIGIVSVSFANEEAAQYDTLDQIVWKEIWATGSSSEGFTPPMTDIGRAPQASTISVIFNPSTCQNQANLSAWPAAAKTSFSHALNIWGAIIESSVPIVVHACWEDFNDARLLGYAGAAGSVRNFPGALHQNVWYPSALANSLAKQDLNTSAPDIVAAFNAADIDWYFGTDGNPGFSQHDFVTVVLHEVGHGLGYSGSLRVLSFNGQIVGVTGFAPSDSQDPLNELYPFPYDLFAQDGSGRSILDTSVYPNVSAQMAALAQSDNLFFAGNNVKATNGRASAKLYAPSPWQQGSSYSHWDLATFTSTPNSLMTPSLAAGVATHSPGPMGAALLRDIGWLVPQSLIDTSGLNEKVFLPFTIR